MYSVIMVMVKYMKQRVISAIIALVIIVPLIIFGGYPYYIGVGILSIIAYHEILSAREKEKKMDSMIKLLVLVPYLLIVMSSIFHGSTFNIDYRLYILDLLVCLLPLIVLNKKEYDAEDALIMLAITMLLGISFNFLIVIRNMNILYLIYVVLITIMSDTFALFVGSKIGRHKLCPSVSPNKTVEGMIGGVTFGTFIGSMFFLTFINTEASIFYIILISMALSLIAEFGDLVFSSIKRRYGIKDYGKIMPGHGGVLDRLDSILFAILAFAYFVSFF